MDERQIPDGSESEHENAKQRTRVATNAWVASLTRVDSQSTVGRMYPSGDSSHISQRLEVGRKALEMLASIAAQLENAKVGLVRSAYLTGNLEELPPDIRRLWKSLDKDLLESSAQDLAVKLLQLERLLAVRLAAVMPTVESICAAGERREDIAVGGMRAQLQDLSRLASTALAIRLLAHRKNFKLPPSQLPISADDLRDKALRVRKVERVHKLRVITHMHDMVKATVAMIGTPDINDATKSMLRGVLRDLQSNARHLASGGSFASLPVRIEEVEMSGDDGETSELSLVDEPAAANVKPPEPAPSEPAKPAPAAPKTAAAVRHAASVPVLAPVIEMRSPETQNAVLRLWRHLRTWMKAPMGVTWSEARLMMNDESDS